ncbi:MAG: hypothetical protein WKF37_17365 [Bryobacteraceae bacterium]
MAFSIFSFGILKAIATLEEGIASAPGDELLYLNLGRIYIQSKRG